MPNMHVYNSGDRVMYKDIVYYARPNGNSIRLYRHKTMKGSAAHTPATANVQPAPNKPANVVAQPHYMYVSRDVDLPKKERRVKLGITSSLRQRNRPYRTLAPASFFIITVSLPTRAAARDLEKCLMQDFGIFRVDTSEVFEIRPHEVERALRRYGYAQCDDGHYRIVTR